MRGQGGSGNRRGRQTESEIKAVPVRSAGQGIFRRRDRGAGAGGP